MNTLHILTFVKNEQELIESFIKYHSVIANRITIIDNGSTDSTLDIVNKYLNDQITLVIDTGDFDNKGDICTKIMRKSNEDLLIPLDCDDFLLYDDGTIVSDDPILVRKYLQNLPIDQQKYKINNIYNKISLYNNAYEIQKNLPPKMIYPRSGFVNTDCGFHDGKMLLDNGHMDINISYLHMHYYSKNRWLKSSNQKLKARLKEKDKDIQSILELAASKNKSHHIAKEMVRYLATNQWHNLKPEVFFDLKFISLNT